MPIETMPEWMIEQSIHVDDIVVLSVWFIMIIVAILILLWASSKKNEEIKK